MKRSDHHELLKTGLQRRLKAAEEAQLQTYFAAHPEAQAAWEEEASLSHALRELPDVPLSSNFTAQVLRRAEAERGRSIALHPAAGWGWIASLKWARQAALAAAVFALGLLSHHQYQLSYRAEVVRSAATVSSFATVPSWEMLQNFEAIHRLEDVPPKIDVELLAALQ